METVKLKDKHPTEVLKVITMIMRDQFDYELEIDDIVVVSIRHKDNEDFDLLISINQKDFIESACIQEYVNWDIYYDGNNIDFIDHLNDIYRRHGCDLKSVVSDYIDKLEIVDEAVFDEFILQKKKTSSTNLATKK